MTRLAFVLTVGMVHPLGQKLKGWITLLVLCSVGNLFIPRGVCADNLTEPWSVSPTAPVLTTVVTLTVGREVPLGVPSLVLAYQRHLSPVFAAQCAMYPSCSRFSLEAMQAHGATVGMVMTTDRLLRERGDFDVLRAVRVNGLFRYLDPISANDFWWHKSR